MADVDISTEATEKGWRRNYGKRATSNTSQPCVLTGMPAEQKTTETNSS